MSRERDQQEIDSFWNDMEQETGEKILHKGLIRVINSRPLDLKDKWLLFFSSPTGLYYKRYPSGTVMGRLLNQSVKVEDYPPVYLSWDRISFFLLARPFFSRIFSGPDRLKLSWGDNQFFLLELDSRCWPVFEGRISRA